MIRPLLEGENDFCRCMTEMFPELKVSIINYYLLLATGGGFDMSTVLVCNCPSLYVRTYMYIQQPEHVLGMKILLVACNSQCPAFTILNKVATPTSVLHRRTDSKHLIIMITIMIHVCDTRVLDNVYGNFTS